MSQPTNHLSDAALLRGSTVAAHSLAVARVIQTMRADLSEPLSLEAMAEIACLSPFHFNRTFRSIAGVPPGEFLAALRLDAAKRLLLTTSLSVTEVCFELGYASLGTFANRFKQLVGLSPTQLRHMADDFTLAALESLADGSGRVRRSGAAGADGLRGAVTVPGLFSGLIFLGLFPRPIPQSRPVACVTLTTPGTFQIAPIPDGRYHLLGAALPWSRNALTYLVPDTQLLVGAAEQPVVVRCGEASAPVDLAVRPLDVADPPILGVFPPLLAATAAGAHALL